MTRATGFIAESFFFRSRISRWRAILGALAMVVSVLAVVYAFPASAAINKDGHLTLSGGDYVSTSSFAHGSGDMDIIFYAAASDWSNGKLQTVVSHWGANAAAQAVRVQFSSKGHLQLVVRDGNRKGHTYSAWNSDMKLSNGKGYWFRVRFNAKTTAGSTTKFFVTNDPITTSPTSIRWGTAKRVSTDTTVGSLNSSGAPWAVGAANGGAGDRFAGDLGYVGVWRNGWSNNSGALAMSLNFRTTDQSSNGFKTWTENGHKWTVSGSNWKYNEPTGDSPTPPPAPESNYMYLDGSTGTHMTTASLSNGTGDMEFQFYVAADDYTKGIQTVASRWPGAADQSKIRVQFTSAGLLQLLVKDTSGGASWVFNGRRASELGLADGAGRWFRIRLDAADSGRSVARFWSSGAAATADPAKISWGSADKVSTQSSAVTPRNNSGKWEIGSYSSGSQGTLAGDVHYVAFWRDGYASTGTRTFALDLRDSTMAAADGSQPWSAWQDAVGNVWSARGNGWTYVTDDNPPPPPPAPTNGAPTAKTDNYTVTEGQTLAITKSSLLSNDTDPDGDALSVVSVSSPSANGRNVTPNGTRWDYVAAANAGGTVDTITYTIEDTAGNRAGGTIKVTIENETTVPSGYDVIIRPGDNFQSIVNNKPAGTSFYVKAGKYRLQEIKPKDGMTFVAEPGAILSGAKKLTQFSRSSGLWVASGQTQGSTTPTEGGAWGACYDGKEACVYPQQLFVGNKVLFQVKSKSQIGPGKWWFDYANDKIWFADDPTGKTVETSVASYAFHGSAANVHIEGFIIERYATPGQQGTINMRVGRVGTPGRSWTIKNNEIRYNHGIGIKPEDGTDIIGNHIHHMGQMGIGGSYANNLLIKNNELSYDCIAGFQCFGVGGGPLKLNNVVNATLVGNYVHDNPSHGLHMDQESSNIVYANNVIVDNQGAGISHEISGSAVIRDNVIERNGFRANGAKLPGIIILSSKDTEVYGNTLKGNAQGILGRQDTRTSISKLTNLWVHNNDITMEGTARTGLALDGISDTSYFTSRNNRFQANNYTFKYSNSNFQPFKWSSGSISPSAWKSKGMDTNGTFTWK